MGAYSVDTSYILLI